MKSHSSIKASIHLIVFILLFNSCSKENSEVSYDLTGTWKVAYFLDNGGRITKSNDNTWLDINNGDIIANFTKTDTEGKGTVSGIRVSNRYNGNYIIYGNGEISFGQITQTEINEPGWTDLFDLGKVDSYQIKNAILMLSYNNGKNIIAFERN